MTEPTDPSASIEPTAPTLEPLLRIVLRTADPVQLGDTPVGAESVAPVVGGVLSGPGVEAVVRAVGAEHAHVRADGSTTYSTDLLADVESDDPGAVMRLTLNSVRFGSAEVVEALDRGEDVESALYYFRGTLTVSTSIRTLAYLNRAVIVTSGSRQGTQSVVDAFLVT
ncbi:MULTISPECIES: DUF3237 domain-containing protein [unclassified Rhodococcus (in: high G+C Gram-positive bacteria)]|uniref:DUF3237 domain-containing protein n=1 Tax=unclassified Rhodococcus (in: high G+C Gram-positive bacteria) TaxID=192944 RepID=UPI0006FFB9EF|nr:MULTISPECIES: DUF3237 domain-containing protein [unclassified Rhodococcus (in: high G+C Gram-positive bacteria)]KQU34647.1 hypothetical protein ASG69_01390 [Rhodococcus sp. Leaf225]KQU45409.1 hypothetical protein ASH03_08940 [Rhodococcus sp. Leaf258]MBY6675578.1 DUF3237 family protein [Rhodococcus sp. BP-332]MBY6687077.1 DUF3237 family protein [Rhodococcus sp. BP-288]MBY6693870.1 DUF3237 family protein [Rhodococcus sp. BP-188]